MNSFGHLHLVLTLYHHLLSYYLANKRSLHIRSQGLEIPTLIGEKKKKKNYPPLPLQKISLKYPYTCL